MHILYVGYYVEDSTFSEIVNRKINNMSVARQKFEYNIIRGLHEQLGENVSFISYVPTDGKLMIPPSSIVDNATITHLAIQKGSVGSVLAAYTKFRKYLLSLGEEKLKGLRVLMYAVIPPFEQALLSLKKKYGIKIITICSEVPALRRYGKSISASIKKNIMTLYNEQFDGYVFFSDEMKNVVKCKNKPTMVLEGIAPEIRRKPTAGKKNVVMYAGGLAADNNIPFLLECCKDIPELDEVWICGVGPDVEKVKEIATTDSRIRYFGRLNNEKVMELEEKAKVLVNFRSPDVELTKYSFPSKILEYISAGSLVISTRLRGIPEEYFNYIVPIYLDDKESIIRKIVECLIMDDKMYYEKCKKAQQFIEENKSYNNQTYKVIDFIKNI